MRNGDSPAKTSPISIEPLGNSRNDRRPSTTATILVGMIDDDPFLRECMTVSLKGACHDLDVVVFAECSEVLKRGKLPDVILSRHTEPTEYQAESALNQPLLQLMREKPLIFLTSVDDPETIIKAFQNGVRGYIPTKTATIGLVIEIIRLVKAGGTFVPRSALPLRGVDGIGVKTPSDASLRFTPREKAVLGSLKHGASNKIIAHELKIRKNTVKFYIRSIMKKLGVTNRTAVIVCLYSKI